jgi:glyoxylase-like metal-dependent hydrolase (beta-lactamase superfamily II)
MGFLVEPIPRQGVPLPILPGLARIVAGNSGVMTYHGTNTYLLKLDQNFVVIDPGPDDDKHVAAVLKASEGRVSAILLTHTHPDHLGACPALQHATGASIYAFAESQEPSFSPDVPIHAGDELFGMMAIHTPGHARDHLCYSRPDGVLFTGDHVMSWSSSVVSPPNGNMAAYCESLRLLLSRDDSLYLPGHGPPLPDPQRFVQDLLAHRIAREEMIARTLHGRSMTVEDIATVLYAKKDKRLQRAAERNVIAHLEKLAAEGRARETANGVWTGCSTPSTAGS